MGKVKQILLILFVSLCSVLMVMTIILSVRDNINTDQVESINVHLDVEGTKTPVPQVTPTVEPDGTPIPTEAYWERQQG